MGREETRKKHQQFDGESDLSMISWWADEGSVDLLFKRDFIGGCDHEQSGI